MNVLQKLLLIVILPFELFLFVWEWHHVEESSDVAAQHVDLLRESRFVNYRVRQLHFKQANLTFFRGFTQAISVVGNAIFKVELVR